MVSDKTKIVRWLSYLISAILVVLIIVKLLNYYQPKLFVSPTIHSDLNGEVKEHDLDIVFGSDTAPLTVYMYSHYTCKYCVKFLQEDFPKIEKKYIKTGKIRFVLKLIELSRNRDVLYSLQAAVCVNRFGSFDKFNELLLSNSGVVFTDEFKELINGFIDDNSDIAECILNNNNYHYIYANNHEFMQLGLKGTPTFIINNHVYSGSRNYRDFRKIVEKETDK
jgi:hypothetical protein